MATHTRSHRPGGRRAGPGESSVHTPPPPHGERSLLDAIAGGELDDHLAALAAAVDARRRLLHTVRSATVLATLCVGDHVRFNHRVSPRYLAGLHATVIEIDDHAATVRLERPVGRFDSGRVRCPPLALEKLAPVG
jgi:hypothetical protein